METITAIGGRHTPGKIDPSQVTLKIDRREDEIRLRIDDKNNPDFWMEFRLQPDELFSMMQRDHLD